MKLVWLMGVSWIQATSQCRPGTASSTVIRCGPLTLNNGWYPNASDTDLLLVIRYANGLGRRVMVKPRLN
ncbi:MAG: hypothetical protein ABSF61_04830 [Anaerolineales bacterium]